MGLTVGPFVGPNPAVLSRIKAQPPGTYGLDGFAPVCRYFVAWMPSEHMLHTREAGGSKPPAPITKGRKIAISRHFAGKYRNRGRPTRAESAGSSGAPRARAAIVHERIH